MLAQKEAEQAASEAAIVQSNGPTPAMTPSTTPATTPATTPKAGQCLTLPMLRLLLCKAQGHKGFINHLNHVMLVFIG